MKYTALEHVSQRVETVQQLDTECKSSLYISSDVMAPS